MHIWRFGHLLHYHRIVCHLRIFQKIISGKRGIIRYFGKGTGDLYIKANCGIIFTEIYICDSIKHIDSATYTSSYSYGDHSIIIDNNLSLDLPSKYELSFEVQSNIDGGRFGMWSKSNINSSTCSWGIGMQSGASSMNAMYRTTSSSGFGSMNVSNGGVFHKFKFIVDGESITSYIDDTFNATLSLPFIDDYNDYTFAYWVWRTGTINLKNLILKPL